MNSTIHFLIYETKAMIFSNHLSIQVEPRFNGTRFTGIPCLTAKISGGNIVLSLTAFRHLPASPSTDSAAPMYRRCCATPTHVQFPATSVISRLDSIERRRIRLLSSYSLLVRWYILAKWLRKGLQTLEKVVQVKRKSVCHWLLHRKLSYWT